MSKKRDFVVRISEKNYTKIKDMMSAVEKDSGKKPTLNEITEKMLGAMDALVNGEVFYLVGADVFEDLADARGEAIMQAVKDKRPPVWPKILVGVGDDQGA